jgi:hypothetical protein
MKRAAAVVALVAIGCGGSDDPGATTKWYAEDIGASTYAIQVTNISQEPIGRWQLRLLEAENWIGISTVIQSFQSGHLGWAPAGDYELIGLGESTDREYTAEIRLPPPPIGSPLPTVPD